MRVKARALCLAVLFLCAAVTVRAAGSVTEDCRSVGLTPESLAVSGFSDQDALLVLVRMDEHQTLRTQISALRTEINEAVETLSSLQDQLQADCSNDQLLQLILASNEAYGQLRQQEQVLVDTLFQHVLDGVAEEKIQNLFAWRSSRQVQVPPEFKLTEQSETEWQHIEQALRAEARALRLDEALADEHQSVLDAVRADPVVITGANALDAYLASITLVFDNYATE